MREYADSFLLSCLLDIHLPPLSFFCFYLEYLINLVFSEVQVV